MRDVQPPKWINRLLSKMVNEQLWENIEGDLHEIFLEDLADIGESKAKRKYILNGLAFLRFNKLRKGKNSLQGSFLGKKQHSMDLFTNYLKVSWRDLKRHKTFTAINLIGLVTGFTACLMILEYVFYETGFDSFHPDYEETYRVVNDRYQQGNLVQHGTITYPMVGPAMVADFPEVESYTRMTVGSRDYVNRGENVFMIENYLWADEHFLDFFDFPLLHGDKATALDEPYEVLLTEGYAERLLKSGETTADLVGKPLDVFGGFHCKISGILDNVPENSHLQFDLLLSFESMVERSNRATETSWNWSDFYHYVKLKKGTDRHTVEAKLATFSNKYFTSDEISGGEEKFWLQPLNEAHLYSDFEYELGKTSNGKIVWLMLLVALMIVLIAWINFMNLSTSRAVERAKEVGIRKSLGALKGHLFYQFLSEALLINGLALLFSLGIIVGLQDFYNDLTGLPLSIFMLFSSSINNIPFLLIFLFTLFTCLLLVSAHPSHILSRFKTQEVIKGKYFVSGNSIWFRKMLVVIQFAAAIVLISGTITVYQQIDYMQKQDLGMDMGNTVVFYGPRLSNTDSTFISGMPEFKSQVMGIPGVLSVTTSGRVFSMQMSRDFQISVVNNPSIKNLTSNIMAIDYGFMEHYDIDLLAGRLLRKNDHHIDWRQVHNLLINESSLKQYGFPDARSAIGEKIVVSNRPWEIVGVVEDFHQRTLHTSIEPIVFMPYYGNSHYYSVKMVEGFSQKEVQQVADVYQKFYPGNHVDYFYMSDFYNQAYQTDGKVKNIAQVFTLMAIVIAVLGLYGLVLITISKRTKEIAVRKVLGANIRQMLFILGKDFIALVGLAILISLPISYYALNQWLENYEYRIGIQWPTMLLGAISLAIISLLTILVQAGKIAKNNPVDSLKSE